MPLKSYFTKYANATITTQVVATGALVTDPETGNVSDPTITFTATCLLKAAPTKNEYDNPTGVQPTDTEVSGYLVNPMHFPSTIKLPHIFDCVLDGRQGKLDIYYGPKSPFGVEKYTGDVLKGVFRSV